MNDETLFHEVLKRPLEERESFLQGACGNDEARRQRLQVLLKAHEHPAGFLVEPCVPPLLGGATAGAEAGSLPENGNDLDFLEPASRPDSLGRLGHYEILSIVGRGGFGIVLRAFDEKLHRVVAIKALSAALAASATARRRFAREAQAAAAVSHDNIVRIYAVEEAAPIPYLVMEFVEGISLDDKLKQDGPLELRESLRIGLQIAEGLAAAHKQGLVHRDVKPANILLENGIQRVKITDFGLARAVDDVSLTQSGVIAGTPLFMSPEQARGEAVDARSDLFSLGSVLYALCAGQPPFRGSTTLAVMKRVCEESPRPIRELNPDVPQWLVKTIDRLLAKQPRERFQSAAEVAELFGQKLALLQQPQIIVSPSVPLRRPAQFRSFWIVAGVAIFLLAAGLLLTEFAGITHLTAALRTPAPKNDAVTNADAAKARSTGGDSPATIAGARSAAVPVEVDPSQPFVILARADQPAGTHATLSEAVLKARDGDTIEIRGNGPYTTKMIQVSVPLTIRAGTGFEPVIRPLASEPVLLETRARLVLEGLEFQRANDSMGSITAVNSLGVALYVTNCRLTGCELRAQILSFAQVRNCLISSRNGHAVMLINCPVLRRAVLDSNVVRTGSTPAMSFAVSRYAIQSAELELTRNLIVSPNPIALAYSYGPRTAPEVPVRVRTSANILSADGPVIQFQIAPKLNQSATTFDAEETEKLLRKVVVWSEERNVYPENATFLSVKHRGNEIPSMRHFQSLPEWYAFWGLAEAGCLQGYLTFARPEEATPAAAVGRLDPADFRLKPGSTGHAAGPDGKDLGPQLDIVGPGAAYERWKQSPEYRQWLKETGQVD